MEKKKASISLPMVIVLIVLMVFVAIEVFIIGKTSWIQSKIYEYGETSYHVKNEATIDINQISEISELEVIDIYETVYVTEDDLESEDDVVSWIKVPGSCSFVVNLAMAEFITDSEREYVQIYVPEPELSSDGVKLKGDDIERLFSIHGNSLSNIVFGSMEEGENVAREQLRIAQDKIRDEVLTNNDYITMAKESAERRLTQMVKSLNPEFDNLKVEILYY